MKKILWTILAFLGCTMIVNAASYSISVGSKGLTKGGTTTLTISGSGVTGRFNIKTSDASVVSVSEGSVWIENNSYKVTLKALKVGNATITVTPTSGTSDASGNAVNLGSKSVSVSVSLPREKSKNNNLKALSVEGYEISPAFDANTLEYTTTVPSTVNIIKINATKADNYASISGTGEFEVVEGANAFNIVVTSETGVEKVYKVNVIVEDLTPIEVQVNGKTYTVVKNIKSLTPPENYTETTVNISDNTIPAFYNDNTKYTLVGLKDSDGNVGLFIYDDGKYLNYAEIKSESLVVAILDIPKTISGYKTKEITIGNSKVKALVVKDGSNFAVVYGINVITGEKSYYEYNIKDNTLSKYNDELITALQVKNKTISCIMLTTSVACALFFILTLCLATSNSRKKKLINKIINEAETKKEKKNKKEKVKKEESKEERKEEKIEEPQTEEPKEEIKEETEVYNLFEEDKKKKKKSK